MIEPKDTVLIFDYDGTLNQSEVIYIPSFLKVYGDMVAQGIAPEKTWDPTVIARYLGCNAIEMWSDVLPGVSYEEIQEHSRAIGREMVRRIEAGESHWYDGAEETVTELAKRGYRMVVLSNCRKEYLQAHRKAFAMDRFFSGYYDCASYNFIPKEEIFPYIQAEHPAKRYVVIGDRRHDLELGKAHGLFTIGCSYGYGKPEELEEADTVIREIGELTKVLG